MRYNSIQHTRERIRTSSLPTKHLKDAATVLMWYRWAQISDLVGVRVSRYSRSAEGQNCCATSQPVSEHNHYLPDPITYKLKPLTGNYEPPPTPLSAALFDTRVQINSVKLEGEIDFWAEGAFVRDDLNVCNFTCAR